MGKISLRGLFVRYLRTLHSVDDDSLLKTHVVAI